MAFTMRQPFRLTSAISVGSKLIIKSAPARALHQGRPAANTFFSSKQAAPIKALPTIRNAFRQQARTYMQQPAAQVNGGNLVQKLLVGGAMFGGTLIAINAMFNRETREDGGMPAYERSYLNDTFLHTGLGVGIIGITARAMYQSGFVFKLMATNPWVVMIGGLALSIGTMMGTRATDPSK